MQNAPEVKIDANPFNWLPQSHLFGSWAFCTYCGQTPECSDHVIPFSMISVRDSTPSTRANYGLRTPACKECNLILSARYFDLFQLRCEAATAGLHRKYRKRLNSPDWEGYELRKLRGSLQDYVAMRQREKETIRERIAWQDTLTFKELIEDAIRNSREVYPHNDRLIEFLTFML